MRQDLRYAVRMLVRTPGITLAVLLSLGLGIGANVTIFSWVRGILLEPFPGVADQSSLVMVTGRRHGGIPTSLSFLDYVDMRNAGDLFEGGLIGITNFSVNQVSLGAARETDHAEQISAAIVSGNYPRDVVTFAAVSGLLAVAAVLASLIPAQRASRVDPIIALRHL